MMEVNEVQGVESSSITQGEYVVAYNGSSNPNSNQLLVKSLNSKSIRAGY